MRLKEINNLKRGEEMKQSTKKLTALFLSMCMAASVMTTASVSSVSAAETESAVSYDDDYAPEIAAVTAIQKYAAAYEKFNAAQLKYADVNKDGAVDINDATAVQKYIAGIIKSFD